MNILMVGDVGEDKNRWIHIGDEAMFLRNYYLLNEQFPNATITLLSRSQSHQDLDVKEEDNDFFFNKSPFRLLNFLFLIFKSIWWRIFKLKPLNKKVARFLHLLKEQDFLFISGGGNLNSLFPDYLFNRSAIIWLAKLHKIPIMLSGQTIGPVKKFQDRIILRFSLACANTIVLRDNFSRVYINNKALQKTHFLPDDAYFLAPKYLTPESDMIKKIILTLALVLEIGTVKICIY